jgi:hypothetical protein
VAIGHETGTATCSGSSRFAASACGRTPTEPPVTDPTALFNVVGCFLVDVSVVVTTSPETGNRLVAADEISHGDAAAGRQALAECLFP